MISRTLLSLLLASAGFFHLMAPSLFDPAIPFSFTLEINIFAGVLELLLAFGLWLPKTKDLCARMTALWFLLLVPIHIYVSVKQIPMFGFSHPALLWGRTLLQPLLFLWALSLQDKGWIISQRWSDVLFLHYEVEPRKLQNLVPFPLDLFEGKAVVSIVPFVMSRIRFPFLLAIPGLSRLLELNLRTYVRVDGKPAVYFFTLDSNHLPGVLVARFGFSLPYRYRKMELKGGSDYYFKSVQLELKAKVSEQVSETAFDLWATERYALVTKRRGKDLWGVVEHAKWSLQKVEIQKIDDQFSREFIPLNNFLGASYAKSLDVRFRPFITLSRRLHHEKG